MFFYKIKKNNMDVQSMLFQNFKTLSNEDQVKFLNRVLDFTDAPIKPVFITCIVLINNLNDVDNDNNFDDTIKNVLYDLSNNTIDFRDKKKYSKEELSSMIDNFFQQSN